MKRKPTCELDIMGRIGLDPWPVQERQAILIQLKLLPELGESAVVENIYNKRGTGRTTRSIIEAVVTFSKGDKVIIHAGSDKLEDAMVSEAKRIAYACLGLHCEEAEIHHGFEAAHGDWESSGQVVHIYDHTYNAYQRKGR